MNSIKSRIKWFVHKIGQKSPSIRLYNDIVKNVIRNSTKFPKISIVVPLYNEERFIAETIKSIKLQNYKNFEVIIINDLSTDNSVTVAQNTIKGDSRFQIIHHEMNKGLAASRNTGIKHATGKYITFLDADDCLVQHTLWHRIRTLESTNASDIAGSYCKTVTTPETFSFLTLRIMAYKPIPPMNEIDFMSCQGECPFNAHAPVLKTSIIKRFTGFNEKMRHGCEDWGFWLQIMRHGYRFVPSNHIGAIYRQKSSGMIHTMAEQHYRNAENLIDSAYLSLPCENHVPGVPYVYSHPLPYYQKTVVKLRRAVQFIAISYMGNGKDAAMNIIRTLEACPKKWLQNKINIRSLVEAGIRRYLKLSPKAYARVRSEYIKQIDKLEKLILKQLHPINTQNAVDVLFIPHNAYHTYEMSFCLPYLKQNKITYLFINIDKVYKNEGVEKKAIELGLAYDDYSEDILDKYTPKAIFVMNDWGGVVAETVKVANRAGISTVGLVEGVQDYLDTHVEHIGVGHRRHPYQTVQYPLVLGEYDTKFFPHSNPVIVGSPRIEALMTRKSASPKEVKICINSNFTYGVYINAQQSWLDDVVYACNKTGINYVISKHPEDKILLGEYNVTDKHLYDILAESSLLISRFSGAILESMAAGVPVIYYNPHNERVDCFKNSLGAYPSAQNRKQLISAIKSAINSKTSIEEKNQAFFQYHVYTNPNSSAGQRIANELQKIISSPS